MASIRVRLTAWNGGVLALVLVLFATAAYVFLRYATLAQVDRALDQQVRIVTATVEAREGSARGDSARVVAILRDLAARGLQVTMRSDMPHTWITTPMRMARDEEDHQPATGDDTVPAAIDWNDLRSIIASPRDDDAAFSVRGQRSGVRALTERLDIGTPRLLLVATQPLFETSELLETARLAMLVTLPVAVVLALVGGYLLARRALDPIAAMSTQADGFSGRNLHERLSIRNANDELGRLASTFNRVLARADQSLEQQRRFTADASHELRTPVALIRAEADVALAGGMDVAQYREALAVIRDGSVQLSRIVNDLFLLARADAGQALISHDALYLDEVVTGTVHSMRSLAELKAVSLTVHVPGEVPYRGDDELLRGALRNLIENAIRYSHREGAVHVELEQAGSVYRISVTDRGVGIAEEHQAHVFERFFRGERARSRSEPADGSGAGLGLAIAREIAEQHGGCVVLHSSSEEGSRFELILPVLTPA